VPLSQAVCTRLGFQTNAQRIRILMIFFNAGPRSSGRVSGASTLVSWNLNRMNFILMNHLQRNAVSLKPLQSTSVSLSTRCIVFACPTQLFRRNLILRPPFCLSDLRMTMTKVIRLARCLCLCLMTLFPLMMRILLCYLNHWVLGSLQEFLILTTQVSA
jgi:hypothetical protein